MTTEVADEHSVYIESLGGRYVWDEARSCWKWTVYVARARPSSLLRARLTPSRHTSRCAHGLHCHGSAGCRGPGPQRVPVMASPREEECAEGGTFYRSCGMRLSRSPCARGCGVASE